MSKDKTPPAPDYVKVAKEQGAQNLEAIRAGAALNRVNQSNPYGSTSYRNLGGDQWEQTTTLSPEQQAILDEQERNQINLGQVAGQRLGQVGSQGALNLNGLPARVTNVSGPALQSGVNFSDLGSLPTDFSAERTRAEDALYGRASRFLDPQFQQEEEATRTRLINSGNTEGSEAWNNAMADLSRRKEGAYGDARDRAIGAGGDEASRMLADALRSRGQTVSERFGQGEFANTAQGQAFQQSLTNAGLSNEGRSAALSEMLTERNLPLQEFMALYGGAPAPGMQSPGVPQAGTPQAGDYQGAVGQQYGAQMDQYNAQQARNAQNTGALMNLASIAARYYSDERLMTDI
jgi:hypothetical protein